MFFFRNKHTEISFWYYCIGIFLFASFYFAWLTAMSVSNTFSYFYSFYLELLCSSPWLIAPIAFPFFLDNTFSRKWKNPFWRAFLIFSLFSSCVLIHTFGQSAVVFFHKLIGPSYSYWEYWWLDFHSFFLMRVIIFIALYGAYQVAKMRSRIHRVRYSTERLNEQLAQIQVNVLKHSMLPTFMVRCLEEAENKLDENPQQAEEDLLLMSDFLRTFLNISKKSFYTLAEAVHVLALYIDILSLQNRSSIVFEVGLNASMYNTRVPHLIIFMPFIEELFKCYPDKASGLTKIQFNVQQDESYLNLSLALHPLILSHEQVVFIKQKMAADLILKDVNQKYGAFPLFEIQSGDISQQLHVKLPKELVNRSDDNSRLNQNQHTHYPMNWSLEGGLSL